MTPMYILRDALSGRYVGQRDCAADVELVDDVNWAVMFHSREEAERGHAYVIRMIPRAVLGVEEIPEEG